MNQFEKLSTIIESDKKKRKELALFLDYKNVSVGCNKLLNSLRKKTVSVDKLRKIASYLNLNVEETITDYKVIKKAITREKKIIRKNNQLKKQIELRDKFQSYIYVET